MKSWQAKLEKFLGSPEAPAVLTRDLLERFGESMRRDEQHTGPAGRSSWSYRIRRMLEMQKLQAVQRGLFLNRMRSPPASLADAVPWLQRDAVVSLNTVLGEAGVLNNPSNIVTAVLPIDPGAPSPARLGRRKTRAGTVHFHGMPRRILEAGAAEDRLEDIHAYEHVRATPEKALLDWLYLGSSPRSRRTLPPPGDIDIELLDLRRLRRLATAAAMEDTLEEWLNRV